MESKTSQISINIPNYSGPLEILLDLAKTQKVDLADISITKLADQFLEFIKKKLKLQLKKLELIRILSDRMLQKKRLGVHIFTRGMKGGIRSINTPVYDVTLYELLKTYSSIQMHKTFQQINIPKLPVFTTEEGIKLIRKNLENISDWKNLLDLVPNFYLENKMKKTGLAGLFAASLELVKEGIITVSQKKLFDKLLIKKS